MRLIDADSLLERMKKTSRYFSVKFDIEEAPTVDAVPVVHGKWVFNDDWWEFRCSLCQGAIGNIKKYKFCPNCGARMEGCENNE